MAKRSSTVYLEDMFWDMISQYQEKNNLSSRNDALAFMLKEWEMFNQGKVANIIEIPSANDVIKLANQVPIATEEIKKDEEIIVEEDKQEEPLKVDPMIKSGLSQMFASLEEE